MSYSHPASPIPRAFILQRAHSLTGLWLVIFLIEHLLTNSQAALWMGEGSGFVRAVNSIKNLPYLPVIEIFLLGVPFLFHALWGIHTLFSAKYNSFSTNGTAPSLPQYRRNQAYTWQRLTSWILLVGITAHVVQMRFIEYPSSVELKNGQTFYVNRVSVDEGLNSLAERFEFLLFDKEKILELKGVASKKRAESQESTEDEAWIAAIDQWPIHDHQLVAISPSFGVAELLLVRETFKSPSMIFLYSGLVLAACFHAFNGFWTFMISWGVTLTERSQQLMRIMATVLMVAVAFLGLAAIWGSYWLNRI